MDSLMQDPGDGLPEDRVTCGSCRHASIAAGWCKQLNRGGVIAFVPIRCPHYIPLATEPDQRTGVQRWPNFWRTVLEARAQDHEHLRRKTNGR